MSLSRTLISALIVLIAMASSLPVRASDWDWSAAPYLWAAGVSGDIQAGPISSDINLSTEDLLNALDGAFMIQARARQEHQAFYGDLIYLSLDPDVDDTPITGRIDATLDGLIIESGYSRALGSNGWSWLAGARYYDLDLDLEPTLLPSLNGGDRWVDGFIGLEFRRSISRNWNLFVHADIGAGGSDISYGLTAMALRQFSNGQSFAIGYKALGFENDFDNRAVDEFEVDMLFQGLAIAWVFD